jgi:aspartate 1-decarboxylase
MAGLTMQRTLLKSKIHRATVTGAELHYEGSVTVDRDLLAAADIREHEQVQVYSVTSGARLTTYAIAGEPGEGEVRINGAAAHLIREGEVVIIASYAQYTEAEAAAHEPRIVRVDERNRRVPSSPPNRPAVPAALGVEVEG